MVFSERARVLDLPNVAGDLVLALSVEQGLQVKLVPFIDVLLTGV